MGEAERVGPYVQLVDSNVPVEVVEQGEDYEALGVVAVVNVAPDRSVLGTGASVEPGPRDQHGLGAQILVEVDLVPILIESDDIGRDVPGCESCRHRGLNTRLAELGWIPHGLTRRVRPPIATHRQQ